MLARPIDEDATLTAGRLLRQADALESRVNALRAQASDLSREAAELRTQAAQMTIEPVVVRHRPEALAARVARVLGDAGPLSMADLADHLSSTPTRLRAALLALESAGKVRRVGIKRGTRYALAGDEADATPDNVREFQSYETMVRDAAVRLDTFGIVDLQRELPELSEATIRRWLRALEDRGIVEGERVGVAKVYAYVKEGPTPNPTSRPRRETPEKEATRMAPDPFAARRRGDAVAGTGTTRAGSAIVNELIREVRRAAPDVEVKRTAHKVAFMRAGVEIGHCSSTPGASSLKKSRSMLRKAGVAV